MYYINVIAMSQGTFLLSLFVKKNNFKMFDDVIYFFSFSAYTLSPFLTAF